MSLEFYIRTAHFCLDSEGILVGIAFEGAQHTLPDAQEEYRHVMATGRRYPLIIDISRIRSMDRASRLFYAGPSGAEMYTAYALVVGSPLTRALGNLFLGLNKPLVPTKLFTSHDDGRRWLRTQPWGT